MPDVVGAFVGREEVERNCDEAADLLIAPRARGAQERFQFRERELDRIEIRTIGRQKPNGRAHLLDRRPDLGLLMGREVVKDDDIPRMQGGHQHLFDVGDKTRTIDGPIEDSGCAEALETKSGDHGVGLPMTAGGVISEPCAAGAPAVAAQEIRRDAAFIEKDVVPHIAERLPLAPSAPLSHDVGTPLFVGMYGFF
jgi:hypothetical protein